MRTVPNTELAFSVATSTPSGPPRRSRTGVDSANCNQSCDSERNAGATKITLRPLCSSSRAP